MTRLELLKILQDETDAFDTSTRLRDDVLDAMEKVQKEAINFIQCCTQLKTLKRGETVILDNKVDVEVITPESSVLIKDSRDEMLMWVNRERLKTK